MRYSDIIKEAKAKPLYTFHVHWGFKTKSGTLGKYIIDAPNEREARREAKRWLDARFLGGDWRITYVTNITAEAEHAKAVAEYEANKDNGS